MFQRTKICSGLLIAFGSSLLTVAPGAFAQDESVQRVEVTGSSIRRIDAESAVPVSVIKADDLKKQGITSVEQIMQSITASTSSIGTSQVVGASTGGGSFADLRALGQNKTLVLLNGRRLANNSFDGSAPDLNMIPFAAIERIEVLRDGASATYGTDAIGGVINFITRKDYKGGTITLGMDAPSHPGGAAHNAELGLGVGDYDKDGFNIFGFVGFQKTSHIGGTDRPYNTRIVGGLSPTPSPANYFQGGDSGNPAAAAGCTAPNLTTSDTATACQETTSKFVDYAPKTTRISGLLKGSFKINETNSFGLEGFVAHDKVDSVIAPVPYGGLNMNSTTLTGAPNPFYPGNPGAITPNIPLDPGYTQAGYTDAGTGIKPGFIHVKWRDLANGSREDIPLNDQMRLLATLDGTVYDWDYNIGASLNTNNVKDSVAGYSNGNIITAGVLNGVINPFGAQSAAGTALINSAGDAGLLLYSKGTTQDLDGHASRSIGDWLHTGRESQIALGFEARHEKLTQQANSSFAAQVVSSTGVDPATYNAGSRKVYAGFVELNVPILKTLDVTLAGRYDKYSDFGNTTNPKFSFLFKPVKQVALRGSYSTGFRAPSLYELHNSNAYTNTASPQDDPITCPGGTVEPGHSTSTNCQQQFQVLTGGNSALKPEKSKNATLGLVLEPMQDLSFEIDAWSVKFNHAIGTIDEDSAFGTDTYTQYLQYYHRNPNGEISSDGSQCPGPNCGYVDFRNLNLGGVTTNGIDLVGNYTAKAGSYGKIITHYDSTWTHRYAFQLTEGGAYVDNVGSFQNGSPVFRWKHTVDVTWNLEPFSVGMAAHYQTGYLDKNPEDDGSFRKVSDYATFDLFATYAAAKGYSLTLGVRNLADREPPFSNQDTTFQAGYDPRYTDPTGRSFYARGTFSF